MCIRDRGNKKLRVKASKDFVRMNCIMMEITYNTHTIGTIVRLEPAEEMQPVGNLMQSKLQLSVQFIFDPVSMRYLQQDCEGDAQELISKETSEYVNILRDRSVSNYSQNKSDDEKPVKNPVVLSHEEELAGIRKKLERKKKEFVSEVTTYRIVDGQRHKVVGVQSRLLEREVEEQKDLENIQGGEERAKSSKEDAFAVLKSHKTFIETLNDRTVPPSVQRLKYASYLVVLCILTMCTVEFALSVTHYGQIEENLDLIRGSYRQMVAQMQMVFYINKITLTVKTDSPKILSDEISASKSKVELALDEYYSTQNLISLSTLSMSNSHKRLFKEKLVYLHYIQSSSDDSSRYSTLHEAVQHMSAEVFSVLAFKNNEDYNLENDHIYFVLYNGFADLYEKMKESTNLYVSDLVDRGSYKIKVMIAIFVVSLAVLALSVFVIFPMVAAVSQTRLQILALFFDLPQGTVRELQRKCERFVSHNKEEEAEAISMTESNAWLSSAAKTEAFANISTAQCRKKKYKNNKTSNIPFYLKFILAMLVISAYFCVNFMLGLSYLRNVKGYSRELNATSVSHSESFYAIAVLQHLLGHSRILTMTSSETFNHLALREITELYSVTQEMQVSHNDKGRSFTKTYQEAFVDIMRSNLCEFQGEFGFTFDCDNFLEGTTKEGLHPVLINFIETMREILTNYKEISGDNSKIESLLNSNSFANMETSIFELANPALRYLVDELVAVSYTHLTLPTTPYV
eukprot:TRINITY_DN1843_c0_g1_i2.p1 TRINITY_DN1843_c0_g1~~TRINITY_DN1843_c0_g1_i2.p1  ORF type:complete len:743 (+),score=191.93 TRINITY_DN1843_c0_g1_i2:82-2310(+)